MKPFSIGLAGLAATFAAASAGAQDVKVGLVLEYSGPFADPAKQIDLGVKVYQKLHGETVGGRKVEIIRKDIGGPNPDVAKRLAQELVTRDKVDFLAGFVLTPNALAAADISAQAKKPLIDMNAATSIITTKSPYLVRTSFTLPQVTEPLAQWAAKNGIKQAYTMVSDYGPGHDAEQAFQKAFKAGGGQIVGEVRMPLRNPEFSAYVQKVKDLKPEAVFVFVPAGEQPAAIMKTFGERGLSGTGMKILGTMEITDDAAMQSMGDAALGIITSAHYGHEHKTKMNPDFVKAFTAESGGVLPTFMAVGGYDGMAAIYETVKKVSGPIDGDKAIAVLKTLKLESPRGEFSIDPETRDIVQTIHIRKVEKQGNQLFNIPFDKVDNVKDPVKAAK
jgi:branched-chain amino acid transport system substrate-binding protein